MEDLEWLQQALASCYGLPVLSAQKFRDAWRVETPSGPKCFKQVKSSPARVEFTAAAVEHIISNGFNQTAPFLKTVDGAHVTTLNGDTYYATDWLPGREGDFTRLEDIREASKALARFHLASRGFVSPPNCEQKETWGEIPLHWQTRSQQLIDFRGLAKLNQDNPFNNLYLRSVDPILKRVELAFEILSYCNYSRLVQETKKQRTLCHRDYTFHNFLVDNKQVYIIDFDYCAHDIRAYDLGKFIRRLAKHYHYHLAPIKLLLASYQSEAELDSDELMFILAFLYFPQRFWRLANRYYFGKPKYSQDHLIKHFDHETREMGLEANFLLQLSSEISQGVCCGGDTSEQLAP